MNTFSMNDKSDDELFNLIYKDASGNFNFFFLYLILYQMLYYIEINIKKYFFFIY